jgi:hypothetical protein
MENAEIVSLVITNGAGWSALASPLLRICSFGWAGRVYTPARIALFEEVAMLTGRRWRMVVIIGLLALGGCGEPEHWRDVGFTPVAAYADMVGIAPNHYQGQAVLLVLASDADEKQQLEALLPVNLKRTIRELSLGQQVLIAVFQGEKYSSGYGVEIMRIVDRQPGVYIYARFETPQRGQLQEGGTRSPVAVVSVERDALPSGIPFKVHLLDSATGQEVLAMEYAID